MTPTKNECSISIRAPKTELFQYLVKPEKLGLWIEGFVASTPENEIQEGGRYFQEIFVGRKTETLHAKVLLYRPYDHFSFRFETTGAEILVSFYLAEVQGGTELTSTETVNPKGPFYRFVLPIVNFLSLRKQKNELRFLKKVVEQGGKPACGIISGMYCLSLSLFS